MTAMTAVLILLGAFQWACQIGNCPRTAKYLALLIGLLIPVWMFLLARDLWRATV